MRITSLFLTVFFVLTAAPAPAQDKEAAGDRKPVLRLEAGGPTSNVTALAFSPDGRTLYAAGYDKVVRAWAYNAKKGTFEPQPDSAYRVPIGTGLRGAINTLALSPEGKLLAVGGLGVISKGATFEDLGVILPAAGALTPEMRRDEGVIYVFDTARRKLQRALRGHTGHVQSLAFAPAFKGKPPLLVSVARGRDTKDRAVGEVIVWDLSVGKEVARTAVDVKVPDGTPAPALAVVHAGPKREELRALLAWGDGALRLWDARQARPVAVEDGPFNSSVVALPDGKQILSGILPFEEGREGRLKVWNVAGGQPVFTRRAAEIAIARKGYFARPSGLALLRSRPNAAPDHLAGVVTEQQPESAGGKRETFLELRGLGPNGTPGAVKRRVPLWAQSRIWPALAVAPDGSHLAVSGSADHTILVYSGAELLKGKATAQTLRSGGTGVKSVRFAHRQKGKAREAGLVLEEAGEKPRVLTFNFADGSLSEGAAGWKQEEPGLGDWDVRMKSGKDGTRLAVVRGGKEVRAFSFRRAEPITALAFLRPEKATTALLFVARDNQEANEPLLDVYDVLKGNHLLRLSGHLSPVRALALSEDGRLLASAADDQTVCVWTLTALDKVLGEVGGLPGLAVRFDEAKKRVVVETAPAGVPLKRGDVIEALVQGGKPIRTDSVHHFYSELTERRPGTVLTFQVRDAKGKARAVKLTVGQGTVEHLPLFSLFFTRAAMGARLDWLGWHPTGYYESSRREVERFLGWHFNTGRPADPTAFAGIDQYGPEARQEGLLDKLVALGSLEKALEALRPRRIEQPLPELTLRVLEDGREIQPDEHGHFLVRTRRPEVRLFVEPFEKKAGDVVAWQLEGAAPQPFEDPPRFNAWIASPSLPAAKGPLYKLRGIVKLEERKTLQQSAPITLRYQPPAPVLADAGPPLRTVKAKDFLFKVTLRPGAPDVPVRLKVTQQPGDKKARVVHDQTYKGKEREVSVKLALEAGENLIAAHALNEGALPQYASHETAELSTKVKYERVIVSPSIAVESLVALTAGGARRPLTVQPGRPLVVEADRINIQGVISAPDPLTVAGWEHVERGEQKPMPNSKGVKSVKFSEVVQLDPGPQQLRLRAATACSPETVESLQVLYRPPLPEVELRAPTLPGLVLYGEEPTAEIAIEGRLHWSGGRPKARFPMTASVAVNGARGAAATVDEAKGTLRAKGLKVRPGQNHIEIYVAHKWGGDPGHGFLNVRYLRPPRVLDLKASEPGARPLVELTARVRSATPLREDSISVQVNGEAPRGLRPKLIAGKDDSWTLVIPDVPLATAENLIELQLANQEAALAQPGTLKVLYKKPAPKRPEIAILSPAANARSLPDREVKVRFVVSSETPLKRVEVWRGGEGQPVKLAGPKALGEGRQEYEARLLLDWGRHNIFVEAENAGGPRREKLAVATVPEPVEIVIDQVTAEDDKGNAPPLPRIATNAAQFREAPTAVVQVHGTIRWAGKHYPELDAPQQVRLYVNGFQQPAVALEKRMAGGTTRKFKAAVALRAKKDNRIEVDLPGLAVGRGAGGGLTVDCAAPAGPPGVHVVVVAPREDDATKMQEGLRKALDAPEKKGLLAARYYPPLTQERRSVVFGQLLRVASAIRARAVGGVAGNDLVLLYYRGPETVRGGTHYLWMADTADDRYMPETAVELGTLAREFGDFLGAQVLLLDTAAQPAPDPAPEQAKQCPTWGATYRFAALRHRWLGQGGKAGNGRLLSEVRQRLPEAADLRALAELLCERFSEAPQSTGPGRYDHHLPPLLQVPLGGDKGAR
jgi:WD40 repeat protein